MDLLADGLLIAGAISAALYCYVLAQRVAALKNLESGLGGAIAGLSRQVEETRRSMAEAKAETAKIARELAETTARAEIAAGRLELLLATVRKETATREAAARESGARSASADGQENIAETSVLAPAGDRPEQPEANTVTGLVRLPTGTDDAGTRDRAALVRALRSVGKSSR
jgi:hypothetical protein